MIFFEILNVLNFISPPTKSNWMKFNKKEFQLLEAALIFAEGLKYPSQ